MTGSKDEPKKKKMTSVQAAAMYLSGGLTDDPQLAVEVNNALAVEFQLDNEQRAALTRMMGFPWRLKFTPNKAHVSSKVSPYVSTWCKFTGEPDEDFVNRLVDACLRLKLKYDAEVAKHAVRKSHK